MTTFINPYNFIPLGKAKACTDAANEKGTNTGVIEYSVYTKTPLFIPNTSNEEAFDAKPEEGESHKSYDFFSYHNLSQKELLPEGKKTYEQEYFMPVIPGSEMRGMLRTNYEILTNSCLSVLDEEAVLSKRTMESFQPALIRKNADGTYDLYKAEDYLWRTKGENSQVDEEKWKDEYFTRKCYKQKDFPEGCKVYFRKKVRDKGKPLAREVSCEVTQKVGTLLEGYIIKGEDGPVMGNKGEKHCCHIFVLKQLEQKNVSLEGLDIVLRQYEQNADGKKPYQEYGEELKKFKDRPINTGQKECFPVYYSRPIKNGAIMLSPACKTREVYTHKLKDLVKSFCSCSDRRKLCPACSLFGTIGKEFQKTSRVRMSDLTCQGAEEAKDCYGSIVTLPPLSAPKLNNMEFYLKKPEDAWFWTYDYYIDAKGNVCDYLANINGRKFYWHQMDVKLKKDVKRTNVNMTIRPVRAGVTFSGKLYFQKLTDQELESLLWLLNAGDSGELAKKKHGYKLGAAKPLGLGSIAVSVNRVFLRELAIDSESQMVAVKSSPKKDITGNAEAFDKDVMENFEKMTYFEALKGKTLSYPKVEEKDNGYEWFVKNHKGYVRKTGKETKAPNSRNDMYFAEYMEAMEPELKQTRKDVSADRVYSSNGQTEKKPKKEQQVITAKVKEINKKGLLLEVNGKEVRIGCENMDLKQKMFVSKCCVGSSVKVKMLEKGQKGKTVSVYELICGD